MANFERITNVRFHHYKAFREFSLSLNHFNILVGPNNAGKSTVLGAFRILAEGLRKARSKSPIPVTGPNGHTRGYSLDLTDVPVAIENVFFDYDETQPATVTFTISNGNKLQLFFPERNTCILTCQTTGKQITSPSTFRSQYNLSISFVPILGPVEHDEPLYQQEAARLALLTHGAARNFRNIWHHYPEGFDRFREMVQSTWDGMDIGKPEIDTSHAKTLLRMFCPEERRDREIFWAGFGFQVWCQMLTYIVRGQQASLFLIDEPDIYLHADLQRQLIGILKSLGPDILIATHSTEIITEADPDELLFVNKKAQSAKRMKDPTQLKDLFRLLGSNLNPTLTQLAKTRRALFVEGKDFQLISRFARKLSLEQVANRSTFAVVQAEGFNPKRVQELSNGMQITLGESVLTAVIFDRDYRSDEECKKTEDQLSTICNLVYILDRKEIENFLLTPEVLERAIKSVLAERNKESDGNVSFNEDIEELLSSVTEKFHFHVQAQWLKSRRTFAKQNSASVDESTIDENLLCQFVPLWDDLASRLLLVPGKDVLSELNAQLQERYRISLTNARIVESFHKAEIPPALVTLLEAIDGFGRKSPD